MKFLKILFGIIVAIVVIFFAGAIFLPTNFKVERSIIIKVPDSVAYNYAADYNNFSKWSPWHEAEPTAKYSISGTPNAPGYTYAWDGKEVGKGKFEIVKAEPYKALYQKLTFIKPWESSNEDNMFFENTPEGTKVTWTFAGENKSTFDKWMSLMYDGMVGKDYQKGLDKLKIELEK